MIVAALFAAVNVPFTPFLLGHLPVLSVASYTYLGGAIVCGLIFIFRQLLSHPKDEPLTKKDFWTLAAINGLDVVANISLFYGLSLLNASTASLLQSAEIVTTALLARLFFKEKVPPFFWVGVAVLLVAFGFLSYDPSEGYFFAPGALLILLAALCWGLDDNLQKGLARKDPFAICFFKCLTPGLILLALSWLVGQGSGDLVYLGYALLDGVFSYGMAVSLMILALRKLSASWGMCLYGLNPFFGSLFAAIFYPSSFAWNFYVGLALLLLGESITSYVGIRQEKLASLKQNNQA